MITGDGRIVRALQLGAAGDMMKPFDVRRLVGKGRETLKGV